MITLDQLNELERKRNRGWTREFDSEAYHLMPDLIAAARQSLRTCEWNRGATQCGNDVHFRYDFCPFCGGRIVTKESK